MTQSDHGSDADDILEDYETALIAANRHARSWRRAVIAHETAVFCWILTAAAGIASILALLWRSDLLSATTPIAIVSLFVSATCSITANVLTMRVVRGSRLGRR
jgi:hypothetical protein